MPIAWYPTSTAPAHNLTFKFWEVVERVEDEGIRVHAVICDGMSVNRKFLDIISTTKWNDITAFEARNPFWDDPKRTVLLMIDPIVVIFL